MIWSRDLLLSAMIPPGHILGILPLNLEQSTYLRTKWTILKGLINMWTTCVTSKENRTVIELARYILRSDSENKRMKS